MKPKFLLIYSLSRPNRATNIPTAKELCQLCIAFFLDDEGSLESCGNLLLLSFSNVVLRWPHIHWGLVQFHTPSSASKFKATSVSFVATIYSHKSKTCPFKWNNSKEITDTGKEELHLLKYDKFGRCFMASIMCASGWEAWTGYSRNLCGGKGQILTYEGY